MDNVKTHKQQAMDCSGYIENGPADIEFYELILIGLLAFVCIGLLLYIRKRKKQVYRMLALQQQINSLEYPALNEKEIQLCCCLYLRKKINAPEGADIIAFLKEKIGLQ